MTDITRFPGESLVQFANRRLSTQGRTDIQWRARPDGSIYLVNVENTQSKLDFRSGKGGLL
ncbi:hypothetical protein GRI39_02040 [Altererythrobacter indicus]|uniref:Uncharacterized protein n=1 Tax=Altericroceibacterium indicum TaxID=374177 RepID=A0A845A5I9_9SPHN|nr:hypothetical protein [Altericroceibacterium indicum]MXP24827.1 hypothetical protein [Altericroceibacterium indicum]